MKRVNLIAILILLVGVLAACGGEAATTAPTAASGGTTAPATGGASDPGLDAIKQRGKLIVGVKYDVPLYGFLNPETNQVEGFDVDMARAVAARIFGDPNAI